MYVKNGGKKEPNWTQMQQLISQAPVKKLSN